MVTLWEPRRLRGTYASRDYQIKTPPQKRQMDESPCESAEESAGVEKPHPQATEEQNDEDIESGPEELPSTPRKRKLRKIIVQPVLKKRSSAAASSYLLSKLWEPPNVTRTKRDINELDVCLTVYNQEMQQAIEDEEDDAIREVMYTHMKKTRRNMLSHIKHVHMLLSIQSKLKQAQVRQKKLQYAMQKQVNKDA